MTPTLHDTIVLLGLFINGQIIASTSVRNQIVLCEHTFELTPPSSELKGVHTF
jgi:3-dehydroquinate dehydratase